MATTEERLTALETNQKTIFHQIDGIKENVSDIHKMAASIEVMAEKMGNMSQKVDNMDKRMMKMEEKPAKDLDHIKQTIIACVITGTLSAILVKVWEMIFR